MEVSLAGLDLRTGLVGVSANDLLQTARDGDRIEGSAARG
jgi:hypothetical protein